MTRTHDLLITNQLLYRLSYISIFTFGVADLILTNQLLYRLSYTSILIFDSDHNTIFLSQRQHPFQFSPAKLLPLFLYITFCIIASFPAK